MTRTSKIPAKIAFSLCTLYGDVDPSGFDPDGEDIFTLLYFVFTGIPADRCASDLNCDGTYSPADVTALLRMVYLRENFLCPYAS
ncbi:MAG: hypothetical protein L0Z48_08915 [candidate division Zixibacteria bacterium]|nr:hypothetical protein [candidate division Zixibacteria bacterium]MCI0596641.1 hypothetical protein [candidate division Zixibacteria bacterium]